jgi:hypothetical protein
MDGIQLNLSEPMEDGETGAPRMGIEIDIDKILINLGVVPHGTTKDKFRNLMDTCFDSIIIPSITCSHNMLLCFQEFVPSGYDFDRLKTCIDPLRETMYKRLEMMNTFDATIIKKISFTSLDETFAELMRSITRPEYSEDNIYLFEFIGDYAKNMLKYVIERTNGQGDDR